MDDLRRRVERAERNIDQIRIDLARLTARSENFAPKATLDDLVARSDSFATKLDVGSVRFKIDDAKYELCVEFLKENLSNVRFILVLCGFAIIGGLLPWLLK